MLYIALGTIVVTMLLVAGMPVINKIRDRNIILQSKDVMLGINNAVRTVVREGPGSQRSIIIDIGKGNLAIDDNLDEVIWSMESKTIFTEPEIPVREGDLQLLTEKSNIAGSYNIKIELSYNTIDLRLAGNNNLVGRHNLIIRNNGVDASNSKIIVEIKEIT